MTDSTSLTLRRLRIALADNAALVAALVLLVALLGAWLTYGAYVDVGTREETRTATAWEASGGFSHGATVTRENEVFSGRLENRSLYYTRVAPVLDGQFRTRYRSATGGSLRVRASPTLVVRSVAEDAESPRTYWRVTEPLPPRTETDVEPGTTVTAPFSVNVSALATRVGNITDSLGARAGEVQTSVRVDVVYEGRVAGEQVAETVTYRLPLDVGDGTYAVRDGGGTERYDRAERVEVREEPSAVAGVGGPLLLLFGLLAAGVVGAAAYRGRLDVPSGERDAVAAARERAEFDEWITTARLPEEALDGPRVAVDSLEGLVDVAIDTNERVVEAESGTFYVVADDLVYSYEPPAGTEPRGGPELLP